ncbi:hypothetical protein D3C81_1679110 [compost metagenome]
MELREGIQEIQHQVKFLSAVFTSEITLDDEERAGALIIFDSIHSGLRALSEQMLGGPRNRD